MWFRALVLAVVLLAACDDGTGADTGTPAGGDPLDFTAETVRDGQFDGSDHTGEDVVLWFWAPW